MKRVVRLATFGSVVVSVARDFSDINGLWERTTDERSGTWYANLKRERRGGNLCLGDKSAKRSAG